MRISKNRLKRIIREECGMDASKPLPPAVSVPAPQIDHQPNFSITESERPELELVKEMEMALDHLQIVAENVEAASSVCTNCVNEIAAQAPVLKATASQIVALQEMLEAQVEVMIENVQSAGSHLPDEKPVVPGV